MLLQIHVYVKQPTTYSYYVRRRHQGPGVRFLRAMEYQFIEIIMLYYIILVI